MRDTVPANQMQAGHRPSVARPSKSVRASGSVAGGACLVAALLAIAGPGWAQDALQSSMAGEAAAEARRAQWRSQNYTIKSGDFKLLATPSLSLEYNDNVNTGDSNQEDDFILRPMLQLGAIYPITQKNLLSLNVGIGYDYYFHNNDHSGLRLNADSGISLDASVKDFLINVHDRFSLVRDAAREPSIAGGNTADYATFNNTAGLLVTGDLNDFIPSLGYDHLNVISTSDQYNYLDRSAEMVIARAGLRLHPTFTGGAEGTVDFTTYTDKVMNDYTAYTVGPYADWRPGKYFKGTFRVGYSIYDFQQTSQEGIPAQDQNSWYFDLTLSHQATEAVGYSFSVGRQLLPGTERSDVTEKFYLRPAVTWNVIRDLNLQTYFSYEHGKQDVFSTTSGYSETYDWFGGGIGLSYPLMKKLRVGLNYRLTVRTSDIANRDYTQNVVGLQLTYLLQ